MTDPSECVRCPQCGGAGWVLDSNITHDPQMLELIPCVLPDCPFTGRTIQRLVFKGPKFTEVTRHPSAGWIMAVGQ